MAYKFYVTVFLVFFSFVCGNKRNIRCFINPGSDENDNNSDLNVVHIIAQGDEDSIHYLWSSYKLPSVFVARTTNDTELKINFVKLKTFEDGAIEFSKEPIESIGLTISEFWELRYETDSDKVTNISSADGLDMKSFHWSDIKENFTCSKTYASVILTGNSDDMAFSKNGSFKLQFSVAGDEMRSSDFPHLIFNGNSTEIKMIFDGLYANYSRTRYGIEIMTFSMPFNTSCDNNYWRKEIFWSVNDEFSPGVFSDVEILPCTDHEDISAFISWRPVAYTGVKPVVANTSDANMISDCVPVHVNSIHSIAEAYFAGKSHFSAFNMTFGTEGDGFYSTTEYTSWSLMIGTGRTVKSGLSTTVIIFLTVGLGSLVLFIVGGVLFVSVRHCLRKDDDLLLSESSIN